MQMSRSFYLSLFLPLLIPPVVFAICALAEGMSTTEMWFALTEQYTAERTNLLVCGLLGLFPILLLLLGLWIYRRSRGTNGVISLMGWCGLIPILLVLVWVNFEYWPSFLPSRTYPGFPHGLEFILGPGFFAPIGMGAGMVVGWWAGRKKSE